MTSDSAPATGSEPWTGCRALVAGFGVPTQRDLDFGRQVVRSLEPFTWPGGVVVEELSCAAFLVLHRIRELRPEKLVFVGAVRRGTGRPGEVRQRRLDSAADCPEELSYTIGVLRQWGALPPDAALIEVEPGDCSIGLGFSEELGPSFDAVLDLLKAELGEPADLTVDELLAPPDELVDDGNLDALADLVSYADARREAMVHEGKRKPTITSHAGVDIVAHSCPWGIGLQSGSDWYDVFALADGLLGVVVGEVPGRGVEAAVLKSDLRAVTQAYALVDGNSPTDVVRCLDRWAVTTGRGVATTLAYLTLRPETGELRLCTAGHCPPLVISGWRRVHGQSATRYLHDEFTAAIGAADGAPRTVIEAVLEPGDTLLLFTDGLVEQPNQPLAFGLLHLEEAAATGPRPLDELCDCVVAACVNRHRREDDLSLVGLRLSGR